MGKEVRRHPYQDQINRMLELIKHQKLAGKSGFWIEHISLSYILLEIELRLLMSSKASPSRKPLPRREIDKQKNLWRLTKLAKRKEFISETIKERISNFIRTRDKAIHRLAYGEIPYNDLKDPAYSIGNLIFDIQNIWLPIEWGLVESYEDYVKAKVTNKK